MISTEKIQLFTFYNSHFNVLKDRFLETLQDTYEVTCVLGDFEANKQPVSHAVDMFIARSNMMCDAIEHNMGKIIVVSDIDIQFFRPSEPTVRASLEGVDMVFQKGDHLRPRNMGFIGIQCNERTLAFWKLVRERIRQTGRWEEIIVNELLDEDTTVSHAIFPETIWTPIMASRPTDIILHHAIAAGVSPKSKLKQMKKISAMLDRGTFHLFKIKVPGNSLVSQLHYAKKQYKEKGLGPVVFKIVPGILYGHLIDKNLGRIGTYLKKKNPKLYARLKPYVPNRPFTY